MKLQEIKIGDKELFLALMKREYDLQDYYDENDIEENLPAILDIIVDALSPLMEIKGMAFAIESVTDDVTTHFMFSITLNGSGLSLKDSSFKPFTWLTLANHEHDYQTLTPEATGSAGMVELAEQVVYTFNQMIVEFNRFHGTD